MKILDISLVEWVGYLATAIVVFSFTLKKIKVLRIVNCIGCICFVFYGIGINWSLPIIITNVFIVAINLYHLNKIKNEKA